MLDIRQTNNKEEFIIYLTSTAGVHKKGNRVELPESICDEVSLSARKNTYLHQETRCPKVTLLNGLVPSKDLPGGSSYKTGEAEIGDKKTSVV